MKKKQSFLEELNSDERKIRFLLTINLRRGDLTAFYKLFSRIEDDEEQMLKLIQKEELPIICITKGYLNELRKMLDLYSISTKREFLINGKYVDFLIYIHISSFNKKIFVDFMNYFMDIDFFHCLEVFKKRAFDSKEVQECFLQLKEERSEGKPNQMELMRK